MNRDECLFCRIADKNEPAYVVWEDEKHVAFLDKFPKDAGHILVIPREHTAYLFDMDEVDYVDLMRAVRKVAEGLKTAAQTERIFVKAIGIHVPHVHIHLIPASFAAGVNNSNLDEVAAVVRSKMV